MSDEAKELKRKLAEKKEIPEDDWQALDKIVQLYILRVNSRRLYEISPIPKPRR